MTFAYRFICGVAFGFEIGGNEDDFVFTLQLGILELALLKEDK